MNLIESSGISSLIVQFITGIFDIYAYKLHVPSSLLIVKELLLVEIIVQVIEGIFYVWLVLNFNKIKNITPIRYFDWSITTPTMLVTLMIYLLYLGNKEKGINTGTLLDEITNNWIPLSRVVILDWLMLIAGYIGEKEVLTFATSTIIGFIPFLLMFYIIYHNFAKKSGEDGLKLFWYFSIVWGIYGVAAIMPYKIKNIMYNILDLFSKNFFGIFIAYVIFKNKI